MRKIACFQCFPRHAFTATHKHTIQQTEEFSRVKHMKNLTIKFTIDDLIAQSFEMASF